MLSNDGWERIWKQLWISAYRMCRNPQDAEDVVQSALLGYLRLSREKPIANPEGYIYASVKRAAIDGLRRRKRWRITGFNDAISQRDTTGAIDERLDTEARLLPLKEHAEYEWLLAYYGDHDGRRPARERVRAGRVRRRMRLA